MDPKSDSAKEKGRHGKKFPRTSLPGPRPKPFFKDVPKQFSDSYLQTGQRSSIEINERVFEHGDTRDYSSGVASNSGSSQRSSYGEASANNTHDHTALLLNIYDIVEKTYEEMSHIKKRVGKMESKLSSLEVVVQQGFTQINKKLSTNQETTSAAITSGNNRIVQKVNNLESVIKAENNVASNPSVITTSDFGSQSKMVSDSQQSKMVSGSQLQAADASLLIHNNQAISSNSQLESSDSKEIQSPISEKYQAVHPFTEVTSSEISITQSQTFSEKQDGFTIAASGSSDASVTWTCQSQLLPLIQGCTLHCISQCAKLSNSSNRKALRLISYNVLSGKEEENRELNYCKETVCPRMLLYSNSVTILAYENDSGSKNLKVGFYKLKNTAYFSTWESIVGSSFTLSRSDLDIENSACVAYNDMIIITSISNLRTSSQLHIHLYKPSKAPLNGSCWSSSKIPLRLHIGVKYEMQSCIVTADFIYCSLCLVGTGAYIYKISFSSLQKSTTALPPLQKSTIAALPSVQKYTKASHKPFSSNKLVENKLLQKHFLAVGPSGNNVFIIAVCNDGKQTIVKVEQMIDFDTFSSKLNFVFSSIVKAITASVIPNNVILIYHDDQECYIKKLKITDK